MHAEGLRGALSSTEFTAIRPGLMSRCTQGCCSASATVARSAGSGCSRSRSRSAHSADTCKGQCRLSAACDRLPNARGLTSARLIPTSRHDATRDEGLQGAAEHRPEASLLAETVIDSIEAKPRLVQSPSGRGITGFAEGTGCHVEQRDVVALNDAREHALHLHHVFQLVILGSDERERACERAGNGGSARPGSASGWGSHYIGCTTTSLHLVTCLAVGVHSLSVVGLSGLWQRARKQAPAGMLQLICSTYTGAQGQ